ncbi:MAG: RNA polymerase sigma-70 factor [Chitinophagaceae bacterium]|nr:RNA polymerase sigma-70 factor [Chitinophagaceae bacterium]
MKQEEINIHEDWAADLRNSDEAAFDKIYAHFYQRLFAMARRFVSDPADAEDMVAESFIRLWKEREHQKDWSAISIFLHVNVKHRCFDWLRHQRQRTKHQDRLVQLLESNADDLETNLVRLELFRLINEAIDRLPGEKMKEILLMTYRDGLKPSEIAQQLHISVQTVKNQRVKAVKLLREAFAHQPPLLALLALLEWTS